MAHGEGHANQAAASLIVRSFFCLGGRGLSAELLAKGDGSGWQRGKDPVCALLLLHEVSCQECAPVLDPGPAPK
eukprot:1161978-Pelagomonas_calceolata.AAC.4